MDGISRSYENNVSMSWDVVVLCHVHGLPWQLKIGRVVSKEVGPAGALMRSSWW